ncbi:L-xylulose reductase-like isoform X1 [Linepithema humile]|uniref:L-xylulose reductase-like isoform X1 n=1 Tax=Linepithema humile TaxID=83485 RepID=UPI000623749C|nr:PREDICTED: L-xylulose reductase-like [Linepithema humile]
MLHNFEGKRVLLYGADDHLSKELARRLIVCNAEVLVMCKDPANIVWLMNCLNGIHGFIIPENWTSTRETIQEILPIDLLINNICINDVSPVLDITPEKYDSSFNTNVKAVLNVSQIVARSMIEAKKGGCIVNISSLAGHIAIKDHALFCSSMAALNMLTKSMALELGPFNIRVNSVNPTFNLIENKIALNLAIPQNAYKILDRVPIGRFAEITEIVEPILCLLSEEISSMITGVCLPIDGGFLAA